MIERYCLSPMKELWEDEYKFQKMLEVEFKTCEAWSKKGLISEGDLKEILTKGEVDIKDIREREKTSHHETVAFVESVAAKIGKSGKYLHYGLTSSDVLDTAQSLIMRDSLLIIIKETKNLKKILLKQARKYKNLVIIGRTHGVHAEPTTLGLKILLWVYELERDLARLDAGLKNISFGKISGSVGTYSQIDPSIEKYVCRELGLKPAKISSQILQRDRYAEYFFVIAMLGNTLEKIALEIRHLHRTEVGEVMEPFEFGQKGSSSMPHKKNPVLSERICGLARVLRGNLGISMENTSLWHERDMSHSSSERIILPDSSCLIHFMLIDIQYIVSNIVVNEVNIRRNLSLSEGKIFSQTLMLKLVEKGMKKEKAYRLMQDISLNIEGKFVDIVKINPTVKRYLSENEIEKACTYEYYTNHINDIFRRFSKS